MDSTVVYNLIKDSTLTTSDLKYISSTHYLIVLTDTPNTKTKQCSNKLFSLTNELCVLLIIDKLTNSPIDPTSKITDDANTDINNLSYKIGQTISSKKLRIKYFCLFEKAYYHNLLLYANTYTGTYKQWYFDGNLQFIVDYKDGVLLNLSKSVQSD